jgi:hypothetical protein
MQEMKASAEKLRAEADYAEQIARSASFTSVLPPISVNSLPKSKRLWRTG